MTDINGLANTVAALSLTPIALDEFWQLFGFNRRPRRGRLFRRFVPRRKLDFEDRLFAEFLALAMVDVAATLRHRSSFVTPSCDYRLIVLIATVDQYQRWQLPMSLDRFLDALLAVTDYTAGCDRARMAAAFATRCASDLESTVTAQEWLGAVRLFQSADCHSGIILERSEFLRLFDEDVPSGTLEIRLSPSDLRRTTEVCSLLLDQ